MTVMQKRLQNAPHSQEQPAAVMRHQRTFHTREDLKLLAGGPVFLVVRWQPDDEATEPGRPVAGSNHRAPRTRCRGGHMQMLEGWRAARGPVG